MKDQKLNEFVLHVILNMTDNSNFPSPMPSLAEISAAHSAFSIALQDAYDGPKGDTVAKNQARKIPEGKLRTYVQLTTDVDKLKMLSSGFNLSKNHEPIGDLPKSQNVTVYNGDNPGKIDIKADAVAGARGYMFAYVLAPATDSILQIVTVTKAKITISRLVSVKKYWFKVAAIGATDTLNYSEPVNQLPQYQSF